MTNTQIAAATGLTPTTVGYLLSGARPNPRRETMQRLAEVFQVPVGELASNGPVPLPSADQSMAERVNGLVAAVRPGGGQVEYSNSQLAEFAGCSEQDIARLRQGSKSEISVAAIQHLAEKFGVTVGYIVDGANAERVESRIALVRELSDVGAIRGALDKLAGADADQDAALTELVSTLLRIEAVQVDDEGANLH
jgi:transcriptional regulator with XRE-family HTH domain